VGNFHCGADGGRYAVQERVQRAFAPTTDALLLSCGQQQWRPRPPLRHPRCRCLLVAARRARLSSVLEGAEAGGCRLVPPHPRLHETASCRTAEAPQLRSSRARLRLPK